MKRKKAIREINKYFDSLHAISWCSFEIAKEEGRTNATNLLLEVLEALGVVKSEEDQDTPRMSVYCQTACLEDQLVSTMKGHIRHEHCPGHDEHGRMCQCWHHRTELPYDAMGSM